MAMDGWSFVSVPNLVPVVGGGRWPERCGEEDRRARARPARPARIVVIAAAAKKAANAASAANAGSERALVVVESPAKAKTIQNFLPKDRYVVESCVGHVRDLPDSAKRIPAKYKDLPWSTLGVDVENDFRPLYILVQGKQTIINNLRKQLADCSRLILATDEDREGEAIAWHLLEVLKPKVPVARAVFHEITQDAIVSSFDNFREVNMSLVKAQETRRILDRLAGYTMSPLLWRKVTRGLSAGRVQSVALDFVVQRESARLRFVPATYWDAAVTLKADEKTLVDAKLVEAHGKRLAVGIDFDSAGQITKDGLAWLKNEDSVIALTDSLGSSLKVTSIERRKFTRKPPLPFITSTMQQVASSKLNMSAGVVMRCAQRLYESGFITYMRTDNPELSAQAIETSKEIVSTTFGDNYISVNDRASDKKKRAKPKNAQEAHEAIRPAGKAFVHPKDTKLSGDELALYTLIHERTLASVMAAAELETMSVLFKDSSEECVLKATGTRVLFPGYRLAYAYSVDDTALASNLKEDQEENELPELTEGQSLEVTGRKPVAHTTHPPSRFSDASLVKEMEQRGVGRPSTYASIIDTLEHRGYVVRVSRRYLAPTLTAFAVDALLSTYFPDYVDSDFTARMESQLDLIARGGGDATKYLQQYYLDEQSGLLTLVDRKAEDIDKSIRQIDLPGLQNVDVAVVVGPFGPYLVSLKSEEKVTLPPHTLPEEVNEASNVKALLKRREDPQIGTDPESGQPVFCKIGPFGPYVQLGVEDAETGAKIRRAAIPKDLTVTQVDLDVALKLLSLPKVLGKHPETGEDVTVAIGRFGPYISHQKEFVSIGKNDDVYSITFERALEIMQQSSKRRKRKIASLGQHKGHDVEVWNGRYGPYLKYKSANIKLPDEYCDRPEALTLVAAEELIQAKLPADKQVDNQKKPKASKAVKVAADTEAQPQNTKGRGRSKKMATDEEADADASAVSPSGVSGTAAKKRGRPKKVQEEAEGTQEEDGNGTVSRGRRKNAAKKQTAKKSAKAPSKKTSVSKRAVGARQNSDQED